MMIYEFKITGYDYSSYLLFNEKKEYSVDEYHQLCANLYIEEMDKALEELYEDNKNEPDKELYKASCKQAEISYVAVLNRLIGEYHFTEIKPNIVFSINDCFIFDKEEIYNRPVEILSKEEKLLRNKYKIYEREQKLKRIVNNK